MFTYDLYSKTSIDFKKESHLQRKNIDIMLEKALQKPLATVIGGAGYGKTQSVSSYLANIDAKISWLQLQTYDNIAERFWEHFIYTVFCDDEDALQKLTTMHFPASLASFHQCLHLLAQKVTIDKKYVLVFDDFHYIEDREIICFIEKIVMSQLFNLSIVIISRKAINFNNSLLISKDFCLQIKEDELRFTFAETKDYFSLLNVGLSKVGIMDIHNYTGGWIFAIYLIGLKYLRKEVSVVDVFSAIKWDIFNLIDKEIFSFCSKKLQKVLIKLSLLNNIPSYLLQEICGKDHAVMEELAKSNSLISYNLFTKEYRIHNIFLDYLVEKQKLLSSDEISEVQQIAAKWYKENGFRIDALHFYQKCQIYDEVFKITLDQRTRCSEKTAKMFIDIIDNAPLSVIEEYPIMLVVKAKFLINNAKIDESYKLLTDMQIKYEKIPEITNKEKEILGEIYLMLAFISCIMMNTEFVSLFKMANCHLPNGSSIIDKNMELNGGNIIALVKNPDVGEFDKHQAAIFEVIQYATKVMNGCGFGMEYLIATEISYNKGNLKSAEKHACQTIYAAQEKEQRDIEIMAYFFLIRISVASGNHTKAISYIEQLEEQTRKHNSPNCIKMIDITKGWFYAILGDYNKVETWILGDDANSESSEAFSPISVGVDLLIRGRCLLAQGKYSEIIEEFENIKNTYGLERFLLGKIEIAILRAISYHNMGLFDLSKHFLEQAYELSKDNYLTMIFVEYGKYIRAVILYIIQNKNSNIPQNWLNNILDRATTYSKHINHISNENMSLNKRGISLEVQLTSIESVLLMDLCQGFTRGEIAIKNRLSVPMVKNILQSVYIKLGASNSVDAVRIATLMNAL